MITATGSIKNKNLKVLAVPPPLPLPGAATASAAWCRRRCMPHTALSPLQLPLWPSGQEL